MRGDKNFELFKKKRGEKKRGKREKRAEKGKEKKRPPNEWGNGHHNTRQCYEL